MIPVPIKPHHQGASFGAIPSHIEPEMNVCEAILHLEDCEPVPEPHGVLFVLAIVSCNVQPSPSSRAFR